MGSPPPPPSSRPVIVEGQVEGQFEPPQPASSERSPWDGTSDVVSDAVSGSANGTISEGRRDITEADSDVAVSDVAEADSALPPKTYLESAERLRQSPDAEAVSNLSSDAGSATSATDLSTTSPEDGDAEKQTFTALGVGSVLLFLAATATLGYVLVNPESLGQLGLERFFGGGTASESEEPDSTAEPASRPTRLPTSPDLAAEEFIQLDLGTLSSLDPETRSPLVTPPPAPQPSPEAAVTTPPAPSEVTEPAENTLDNISALLTPESTGESQPEPGSQGAESATEEPEDTSSENPATEATSGPAPRIDRDRNYSGFIFVVVDYNDQVSRLEQVREVVPDAYLREFPDGVKVQVGAFDDTQTAQALVSRLGEDGISAQVYEPR